MQVKRKAPMEKAFKAIADLYKKDPYDIPYDSVRHTRLLFVPICTLNNLAPQ
jgi:hypothetical protein